jgi:hypothetical protein
MRLPPLPIQLIYCSSVTPSHDLSMEAESLKMGFSKKCNVMRAKTREALGSHREQSQQSRLELGLLSAVDSKGRTIWIADAHRDDGKQFIVKADEKLTTFLELESAIRVCGELV